MNLLIDFGNTRLKWACETKGKIRQFGVLDSAGLSRSVLDDGLMEITKPKSAWVSSVGPTSGHRILIEWLMQRYQLAPKVVDVRQAVKGFENGYEDPDALGVDRWVAAIGARAVAPKQNLIVIDAGTAITIDHLSDDNIFQGGIIHPGAELMHGALLGGTSGIQSKLSHAHKIIGKTTSECVNSGIGFGLPGAVERIVDEMYKSIGAEAQIVLTGGGAKLLMDKTNLEMIHEPNLVLYGLMQIVELQALSNTRA